MADDEPVVPDSKSLESMTLEELIEHGQNSKHLDDVSAMIMEKFHVHQQIISIDNMDSAPKISFDKEFGTICINDFELAMKFVQHFADLITKMELKVHELRKGIETLVRNYPNLKVMMKERFTKKRKMLTSLFTCSISIRCILMDRCFHCLRIFS